MDWECKSLDWTDHDFRKFRYSLGESTVLTKFPPNKVASKSGGLLGVGIDWKLLIIW
jgi:hypothetical protein